MIGRYIFDGGELLSAVRMIIQPYVGVAGFVADLTNIIAGTLQLRLHGVCDSNPTSQLIAMGVPSVVASKAIEEAAFILDRFIANTPLSKYDPHFDNFTIEIDHLDNLTVSVCPAPLMNTINTLKHEALSAIENGEYDDRDFQKQFMEKFRRIINTT